DGGSAQRRPQGWHPGPGWHKKGPEAGKPGQQGFRDSQFKDNFSQLNLTPEQKEKLREVRSGSKMQQLRDEMMAERRRLRELMQDQSSSEKSVEAQLDKVLETVSKLAKERVSNLLAMRKVLNEEQFDKLLEQARQREERLLHRPQGTPPHGAGPLGGQREPAKPPAGIGLQGEFDFNL
ncbi:MAG: Spy/CpxP family protein refolding chaperone, partial [Deltaproteobacteria bacterium]|nr:Spy/CpxP family protein refolding chaperone [Deltaproteobacteria bacterium]